MTTSSMPGWARAASEPLYVDIDSFARDGNHHYSGCRRGVRDQAGVFTGGVAQDQVFQSRQNTRAQSADGPRGHFEHPDAALVHAHFGMDGAASEAESFDGGAGGFDDSVLCGWIFARRRDVDGFFEERTV